MLQQTGDVTVYKLRVTASRVSWKSVKLKYLSKEVPRMQKKRLSNSYSSFILVGYTLVTSLIVVSYIKHHSWPNNCQRLKIQYQF